MQPSVETRGLTRATTSGALTATGAETVHDTTVTISYNIAGKAYAKTAITDGATPTTDYNTGVAFLGLVGVASGGGQGCIMVWGLNSSGAVKCIQGKREDVDAAGNFVNYPSFPAIPDDICPFAYSVHKHYGQGTTFTFGSSNWNTSGHSLTIVNVHDLPNRPTIS